MPSNVQNLKYILQNENRTGGLFLAKGSGEEE